METIKITVTGNRAEVTSEMPVIAGTVGLPVAFTFDESWEHLQKTAVFRANGKTMDLLYLESAAEVPWELLKNPGCRLYAGVYGTAEDGSLQIPTMWADLGVIQPGADPSGDESANPALPVWQQLTQNVEIALDAILQYQTALINGEIVPIGKAREDSL